MKGYKWDYSATSKTTMSDYFMTETNQTTRKPKVPITM